MLLDRKGYLSPQEFGGHNSYLVRSNRSEENNWAIANQVNYEVELIWGSFDEQNANVSIPRKYV